ncbi:hypothetical protein [Erythrobacter sp. YT30]|uniref:hypothetical protein n=1 Tax=Erythrobacter sp. YT30 TaxID=1735012 RepID=UPI00076CC521|nr:hypothetical protein [Erythrobacter sp. YT30]KWV90843.1 hypothetical protein AUC45_05715 [Erythrobacter sp. YT30]
MALSLLETILGARDLYEDVSRFVRASKSGKKAMRSYLLWTIALISTGAVAMHVLPQLLFGESAAYKATMQAEAVADYKAAREHAEEMSSECEQNPFHDVCR